MSDSAESQVYRVLFRNETSKRVKVYFYYNWDILCWVSNRSKFIEPQESYFKENSWKFKYRVESDEILSDIQVSNEATIVDIAGGGNFTTDDFTMPEYYTLRNETLELYRFKEEHKWGENDHEHLDLYKLLGLDMKEIRKLSRDEATAKIKKAFRVKIRKYHSDRQLQREDTDEINFDAITREIIKAYSILGNPIQRAVYHNHVLNTGKQGWRYKINPWFWPEIVSNWFISVYWPDVGSDKEEKERWNKFVKRLSYLLLSGCLFGGGIAVTISTGGLALLPVAFAMFSGGISGGLRAALKQKCDFKDYLLATGVGAIAGAATGGACIGAITGIAGGALGSATFAQQAAIGAATNVVGAPANSVANDIEQIVCDGKNISLKQMVGHAVCAAACGTLVGAVGGTIAAKFGANVMQVGDELMEQAATTGFRSVGRKLGGKLLQIITETAIETGFNTTAQFVEERTNSDIENRSSVDHLSGGLKSFAGKNVFKAAIAGGKAVLYPSALTKPSPERVQPKGICALDDSSLPNLKDKEK